MSNAGCINAISCDGCLIQTLQQLDSANVGVGVQFTAPDPLDDKKLDYIKYTDKCGCTCCLTGENEILIYATQGVIKNLTLTNDEANEVVNVKRTDLFGSNRKKTVVRYKTGSYPTSITDGTLAVEELVKNQYETNGFDVSGLEDGTTYYFSVFAVAQDDTIIIVQTNSITPEFDRQPSSNTIAYFKIDSNDTNSIVYDKKNGNNATRFGSANYETLNSGQRVLNFDGSSNGIYCSNAVITQQPLTVNLRFFSKGNQSIDKTILSNQRDSGLHGIVCAFGSANTLFTFFGNGSSRQTTTNTVSISHNQRINYGFTIEGGTIKKYVNGNLVQTVNGSGTPNFTNPTNLSMGFLRNNGTQSNFRFANIKMARTILEIGAWSGTDFSNYYEKTKKRFS